MGLVEEERHLRLVQIADLGQLFEEFGQQPQQHGRIEARIEEQLVGGQHVDDASTFGVGSEQIAHFQGGLAEEAVAALLFEHEQPALDRADAGRVHVAVLLAKLGGVLGEEHEHRAQVVQIEQQKALLVRDLERDVQHTFLGFGELKQSREQDRPHLADRGAQRVALLAEHVPEHDGRGFVAVVGQPDLLGAGFEFGLASARCAESGEVALHVGEETRDTHRAERLGHHLQADRLARARGSGDESMAVGEAGKQVNGALGRTAQEDGVGHGRLIPAAAVAVSFLRVGAA